MNISTLKERVDFLQKNVDLQSKQFLILSDNLKVLQGNLGEAQFWLKQLEGAPTPLIPEEHLNEGESHAPQEGNEQESDSVQH